MMKDMKPKPHLLESANVAIRLIFIKVKLLSVHGVADLFMQVQKLSLKKD